MSKVLSESLGAILQDSDNKLYDLGVEIGKLFTDRGFPLDMSVQELKKRGYKQAQIIAILNGALHWLVIHKRNSGANDKAIDRQRAANVKFLDNFITKGETGAY